MLEYLSQYFSITVFYYNPNISPKEEYEALTEEVQRLIRELPAVHPIRFVEGKYDPECYYEAVRGHREGIRRAASAAVFVLRCASGKRRSWQPRAAMTGSRRPSRSVRSKMPGASIRSGRRWEKSIMWHFCRRISRKEGYKRSIELSAQYHLYRQNYCGCVLEAGAWKSRCRRREGRKHRDLRGDMFGRR